MIAGSLVSVTLLVALLVAFPAWAVAAFYLFCLMTMTLIFNLEIERRGLDGYAIHLPHFEALRIRCGRRPQFSRPRWSGVYRGGVQIGNSTVWSWETAPEKWRAICFDFVYWRVTVKLWALPVNAPRPGR